MAAILFRHQCAKPQLVKQEVNVTSSSFNQHGLTFIPLWISNCIHYKVCDEITYPFPNFSDASNFILHIFMGIATDLLMGNTFGVRSSAVTVVTNFGSRDTWRLMTQKHHLHVGGLVQGCSIFPTLAIEIRQSCTEPSVLQWRHNGFDGVSIHQAHDCLLSRLFRHRSKKTSKLRVTGLCVGNSPRTGEFPAQMTSNVENVSIWWRHHVYDIATE